LADFTTVAKMLRTEGNAAMADRITVDFGSLTNNQLAQRGLTVVLALKGNDRLPNLPLTMEMLESLLTTFQAAIADTVGGNQGSRKAMALRDSLRVQVISALKQVAGYVQENANGDFSDTGFETYSTTTRKTGQLVTTPSFRKLYRGPNSGEIMFLINAVPYARGYQVEYAALKDGILGPFTAIDVMNVKSAVKISGLTPGTVYAFRVQAIGTVNRSDWSDFRTIMCV
jgi:Fibronectin type III domain